MLDLLTWFYFYWLLGFNKHFLPFSPRILLLQPHFLCPCCSLCCSQLSCACACLLRCFIMLGRSVFLESPNVSASSHPHTHTPTYTPYWCNANTLLQLQPLITRGRTGSFRSLLRDSWVKFQNEHWMKNLIQNKGAVSHSTNSNQSLAPSAPGCDACRSRRRSCGEHEPLQTDKRFLMKNQQLVLDPRFVAAVLSKQWLVGIVGSVGGPERVITETSACVSRRGPGWSSIPAQHPFHARSYSPKKVDEL